MQVLEIFVTGPRHKYPILLISLFPPQKKKKGGFGHYFLVSRKLQTKPRELAIGDICMVAQDIKLWSIKVK